MSKAAVIWACGFKKLPHRALHVLVGLCTFHDPERGKCRASHSQLEERCCLTYEQVNRALGRLEEEKLVSRIRGARGRDGTARVMQFDGVRLGGDEGLTDDQMFDAFYDVYPRKEKRQEAKQAWARMVITDDEFAAIMKDIERRIARYTRWNDIDYVPYPATYINGRRWEDRWEDTRETDDIDFDNFGRNTFR